MHPGVRVAVDVERDRDAGMSEDCADDLRVDAPAEHQGCVAVPEIVEADRRQLLPVAQIPEPLVKLCRGQRDGIPVQDRREIERVRFPDQDPAVAVPGLARGQDFLSLLDGARSLNVDRAVAEVEVFFRDQSENLAPAQSVGKRQPDCQPERVGAFGMRKQPMDLFGVQNLKRYSSILGRSNQS